MGHDVSKRQARTRGLAVGAVACPRPLLRQGIVSLLSFIDRPTLFLHSPMEIVVSKWRAAWSSEEDPRPVLAVTQLDEDLFLLADTRKLPDTTEFQFLNRSQAMMAIAGKSDPSEAVERWALENRVCAVIDGRVVPLATAEPELLAHFENDARKSDAEARLAATAR